MLEHLLTELNISSPLATLDVHLRRSFDGTITAHGQHAPSIASFVAALNKLAAADTGDATLDDVTLKYLVDDVSTVVRALPPHATDDPALESLLQVVALLRASFKIDDLIKSDMSTELIEEIQNIYLDVIDVFKYMSPINGSLLSRVSFISPLLITISFSYKLQYAGSASLLKTLAVLFNYHLIHRPLLHETVKMFSVNTSTNLDVFEVFNKLWEKTLEVPDQQSSLDVRFAVGPVTFLNRIESLKDMNTSLAVLGQIMPYIPNQALSKLAKDAASFYSCLIQLDETSGVSAFLPLLDNLNTNMDNELLLCLIGTLGLEDLFLSFFESTDHKLLMEFIFFKIGNCVAFTDINATPSIYLSKILDADIIGAFNESKYARYKIIFELIDHKYKTDFSKDFQMVISLEGALAAINNDFSLVEEHNTTVEFGSIFSMEALVNYTSFIVQTGLLKFVNSHRELPIQFIKTMSLERFAPLPRSNFLGFSFKTGISEKQLTIQNFDRLVNCAHLSMQITRKVIKGYTESKKYLKIKDTLSGDDINIEYCANHMLLEQYYTTLFTVLIVSYEMSTKAKVSNGTKPSLFYDYASAGNVLKLQVFQVFKDLFKLYGTLAVYELIQFISKISSQDLELQTFGVVLINHLAFHSDASVFKTHVVENELIGKTLSVFVEKWDDGSVLYTQLLDLLKIERRKDHDMVPFTKQIYLNLLGFPTYETPTPSPGHSSMGSIGNNSIADFNISAASQSSQLAQVKDQSFGMSKTTSFNANNNGNASGNNYNYNGNTNTNISPNNFNNNNNQSSFTNNNNQAPYINTQPNNNFNNTPTSSSFNNGSSANYNISSAGYTNSTPSNYTQSTANYNNTQSATNFNSNSNTNNDLNNYQYSDLSKKTSFDSVGSMQYNNANVNGMDYYKSSNIRNVQSFIPKQPASAPQLNSSQLPSSQMSSMSMGMNQSTGMGQATQIGGMNGFGMQNDQRSTLYGGFNAFG